MRRDVGASLRRLALSDLRRQFYSPLSLAVSASHVIHNIAIAYIHYRMSKEPGISQFLGLSYVYLLALALSIASLMTMNVITTNGTSYGRIFFLVFSSYYSIDRVLTIQQAQSLLGSLASSSALTIYFNDHRNRKGLGLGTSPSSETRRANPIPSLVYPVSPQSTLPHSLLSGTSSITSEGIDHLVFAVQTK